MSRHHFYILILSLFLWTACGDEIVEEPPVEKEFELYDTVAYEACADVCANSPDRGKSVGVFGGSISSLPATQVATVFWRTRLGMKVTSYGKRGAGFVVPTKNISDQVAVAGRHDIFIFWCSSNDYSYNHPNTTVAMQNEAMRKCIQTIRNKYPASKIYIFTPLKGFCNKWWRSLSQFAYGQMDLAKEMGLKCCNLYDLDYNTDETVSIFYQEDKVHPNETGYYNFGWRMLYFLATEKNVGD